MSKACDLARNSVVDIGGVPHIVESIQVQSPSARGAATYYKIRFRNVQTKGKVDQSLKGDDSFRDVDLERREVQFLFRDGDQFNFMDLSDYSQFMLNADDLAEQIPYLVENMEGIFALISEDRVIAIELPPIVPLKIVECDPVLRGASVTARGKNAKLSTGLTVQVPEYMENGEVIRVDTRSGKFVSRA